jgi:hypothetical protein
MAASKFNVVVDAPLTKAQEASLNKAIQSAVMAHVAKIDNAVLGRKIDWPGGHTQGIWVKDFRTLDALKKNAAFKKTAIK